MNRVERLLEMTKVNEMAVQYKVILKLLNDAEKGLKVFQANTKITKITKILHDDLLKTIQEAIKKAENLYKNGE